MLSVDSRKRQLMNLRGGQAWRYMHAHFFPELRNTSVVECEFAPVGMEKELAPPVGATEGQPADTVIVRDTVERVMLFFVIRSNSPSLLPDLPNRSTWGSRRTLSMTPCLCRTSAWSSLLARDGHWGATGCTAGWKNDRRHRYWRVYGGKSACANISVSVHPITTDRPPRRCLRPAVNL